MVQDGSTRLINVQDGLRFVLEDTGKFEESSKGASYEINLNILIYQFT